ncbi:MAG: DUF21 domain-containing protein [Candidatus Hydrothermales bacterium]
MIFLNFILLIITFSISFLASGTETALFSLSEEKASRFPFKKERKKIIKKILVFPGIIILTLVTINTFVNTLASSVFSSITFQIFSMDKKLIEIIDTVILGSFIFIFCETLPKNLALKSPYRFLILSFPFYIITIYPLTLLAEKFKRKEKKIIKRDFHFLHELELILFTGDIKEILTESEKNLFIKLIEFSQLKPTDFKKHKKEETNFIEVKSEEPLFFILKKLLKEKKEYALFYYEGKRYFISKKDIIQYVFKEI